MHFGQLTPGQSSQPDGRQKELQEATVIGWTEKGLDVFMRRSGYEGRMDI